MANPDGGHFLQSKTWAEFRARRGFKPRFLIFEDGVEQVAALALERSVAGFGKFWYFSKGPGITDQTQLGRFTEALRQTHSGAFFARVEPAVLIDAANASKGVPGGLERAKQQILKATIIVNIEPDEETVINSFKQKTRYNIRLAARKGVTVEPATANEQNLNLMYKLMVKTQERGGYFLHSRDYFLDLWRSLAEAEQGQLFFAKFEGQVLAGVYAIYLGTKGWYKDGGSIREHSNVMAPYLLQWEVMRWLKGKGVSSYDLVGIPPQSQAGHHIMDSLTHFKSGFNQAVTEWIGTFDLPLKSSYRLWRRGGERLAVGYHAKVKKEFLY